MALQDITTKILDDAKKQATQIARSAVSDAKCIAQDGEKANKAYERQSDQETAQIIESRERTALSRARRGARQIINTQKRSLIDSVIADACAQIVDADDMMYTAFLTRLLDAVDGDVRAQIVEVRAPRERLEISQNICKKSGIMGRVVADDSVAAGMILISAEADYNLTLSRRIADLSREMEAKIAKDLFGV